jgi:hypothetical protein
MRPIPSDAKQPTMTLPIRTRETSARRMRRFRRASLAAAVLLLAGCSLDSILKSDELPPEVTDPAITKTYEGAIAAYNGTLGAFRDAFGRNGNVNFTVVTGLISDELQIGGSMLGDQVVPVDARNMPEGESQDRVSTVYTQLQRVRGQAAQAIGLLSAYAPEERALLGRTYAIQGYAELFLAEFFCSGIPLSTLDYEGDYTYAAGSSSEEVYRHALSLFDLALGLTGDSVRFELLARMGRARALLGLGEVDEAAASVAEVPDDWTYAVQYAPDGSSNASNFAYIPSFTNGWWDLSVSDGEGVNGLDFRSSGDPRTAVDSTGTNQHGFALWHPTKYDRNGGTPIVLAGGVEARLIEAEADLAAGGGAWLATLNALRTDGTFTTQPDPDDPMATDTSWHAGTGGVAGLAPLEDPGTPEARVDLVFRERASWLFLTGHRQGDLRRLVRQYGRAAEDIYPVGAYPAFGSASYGSDVTAPIPPEERTYNPRFTGCISRDA